MDINRKKNDIKKIKIQEMHFLQQTALIGINKTDTMPVCTRKQNWSERRYIDWSCLLWNIGS